MALGFSVTCVRQLATSRLLLQGDIQTNIPLFLVTLTLNEKSLEIFTLSSLSHIIITVEAYRTKAGLTQCCNVQNFSQTGSTANNLPPTCGVGAATPIKSALKKAMSNPPPAATSVRWERGRNILHNYRGSSHAKEEPLRSKEQKVPVKNPLGRVISRYIMPTVSFAAAVRGDQKPHPQPHQAPITSTDRISDKFWLQAITIPPWMT
jgi:hypothetical protein